LPDRIKEIDRLQQERTVMPSFNILAEPELIIRVL
jgi:hypothetical protein